ncbi:MAG: response regulator [Pyrinomonadaceae bacterium]
MAWKILIVDDSAAMRSIIKKTLHLSGVPVGEVFQAPDGKKAIEIIEENLIDLALVDINMPVMDGETMINLVRENEDFDDLPIIVVSTDSSETRVGRLADLGVEFVHKPFAPEELREKVKNVKGVEDEGSTVSGDGLDF